jgi:hypothetical protein
MNGSPERSILLEREMCAEPVIIGGISRQGPAQMRFAEHHDVIEALTPVCTENLDQCVVIGWCSPPSSGRDAIAPIT